MAMRYLMNMRKTMVY